ncbi:MAG TPA: GspE/PulE family protein [Bacillota bacterium]|nr:GspE/PulE family protein [Bacillota bacterium]
MLRQRIGEMLLEANLITGDQLQAAIEVQASSGARLGDVLVGMGMVSEIDLARTLARQLDMAFVNPADLKVHPAAARLISEQAARRLRAIPVEKRGDTLVVAVSDPLNVVTLDDIALLTGCTIEVVVTTERGILRVIEQAYRLGTAIGEDRVPEEDAETERLRELVDEAPIVRLVANIIDQALEERASDIHIEAREDRMQVRFRVDGLLRDAMSAPRSAHGAVVSRIKVMATLDIAERRLPQDGRIQLKDTGRDVDVRVSTLPTIFGEKVVMRLLDKVRAVTSLEELGFLPDILIQFRQVIRRPYGIILVCGPTGSGKTTTLMAALRELNALTENIVTIEDPVEYQVPGVNQIQVNERVGLTFAQGLRAVLRQDPNIVMVGEVRDRDTAEIAIRAALTGHLVLTTIHTNEAAGAIPRLVDMGIEPFLVASSLNAVLAQRLARTICRHCKEGDGLPLDAPDRLAMDLPRDQELRTYRGRGCSYCGNTGYSGRLAIHEFLPMTSELRSAVSQRVSAAVIKDLALKAGMRPLLRDGVAKVLRGLTTLEEIRRVAWTEEG